MNKPISKEFATLKSLVSNGDFDAAHKLAKILAQMSLGPAAKSLLEAICLRYNLEMSNFSAAMPAEKNKKIDVSYADIKTLAQLDEQPFSEGISIVSCCMNRNENLRKALITWLELDVDEIVIGNMCSGSIAGQVHLGALAANILEVDVPGVSVEAACASDRVCRSQAAAQHKRTNVAVAVLVELSD